MSVTTTNPDSSIGYIALVRNNKAFRLLWVGEIISLLGDWFDLIASAALVAVLTQSGTAVGGLFVVRMLAPFLVSPFAGVAADRYNRKSLLILSDIARGITVLGFLLVRDPGDIWLVYVLSAVQLGLSGLFFPARNAILPDITTRRELGTANALSSTTWSVMLAFGAALGGLFAGVWGIYPAFVIDSATFFISALFINRIAYERPPALDADERTVAAVVRQYVEGLSYLRHHLDIFLISLHKAAGSLLVGGAFQVVQVILAEEIFVIGEGGSISLGLMYAVIGVGTGMGPILARRFTGDRDRALRVALLASYIMSAAGLALVATLHNFSIVLAGTWLRGVGAGIGWVFSTQLLLQLAPDYVRGRIFASEFALFTLASAVAAAGGGWLLDARMTVSSLLHWMAGLTLLPALLWGLWILFGEPEQPVANDDSEAGVPLEEFLT